MTALDLWQSIVGIVGFISVLTVLYARFKAETRARAVEQKARETEREDITRWRTNVERDIQDTAARLDRHEKRDDRIFNTLDEIKREIVLMRERIVSLESTIRRGSET